MDPTIRFVYAEECGSIRDLAVITDATGSSIQITVEQAVKLAEWITLNTKVEKKHSIVSNLGKREFLL
jgi:hypothetical protein